jgi:hypothetical protein
MQVSAPSHLSKALRPANSESQRIEESCLEAREHLRQRRHGQCSTAQQAGNQQQTNSL